MTEKKIDRTIDVKIKLKLLKDGSSSLAVSINKEYIVKDVLHALEAAKQSIAQSFEKIVQPKMPLPDGEIEQLLEVTKVQDFE